MMPFSAALSGDLVWSKLPHNCGFELKCNGDVVCSLRRKSFWSMEFQAETHTGSWRFHRSLWGSTSISDARIGTHIATLKRNWIGVGTLVFFDGHRFHFLSRGCWRPISTVLTENRQPVVIVRMREKTVELQNQVYVSEERLALLVILAWYNLQQALEDDSSAAAIVAATS